MYLITFTLCSVVRRSVRSRAVCHHHHHYLMPLHKQAINYYMGCKPKVLKVDHVVDPSLIFVVNLKITTQLMHRLKRGFVLVARFGLMQRLQLISAFDFNG